MIALALTLGVIASALHFTLREIAKQHPRNTGRHFGL
jgi:hypothetical protein